MIEDDGFEHNYGTHTEGGKRIQIGVCSTTSKVRIEDDEVCDEFTPKLGQGRLF